KAYTNEIKAEQAELLGILYDFTQSSSTIEKLYQNLAEDRTPIRKDILSTARKALRYATLEKIQGKTAISKWITYYIDKIQPKFSSHLYSENSTACDIEEVLPTYNEDAELVDGRIVIRDNFDAIFNKYPEVLIFGEDAGKIGDVN